ncbi:hypothetical protein BDV3_006243 [Batrachochytrium dendrobatidis]|uniref:Ribosomal protein L11 methyltransferase (PrmA) n=1 Tax=Batrachochytrium dendrobatidis (strain JEL423) TaxID=403673 RepID=A0A177WRF0_BATDL|nr:ribosomal protein L11 methyltransferase (PrmA) [Batrachochytrium dendrobatidis JEL423]
MTDTFQVFETGFSVLFDIPEINLGGPGSLIPISIPTRCNPIHIHIPDSAAKNTSLFAHHLWKASILLSRIMVAPPDDSTTPIICMDKFTDKTVLELGAGTGLPSILAVQLGASRVVSSDYPDPAILATLNKNLETNLAANLKDRWIVKGHVWGEWTHHLNAAAMHTDVLDVSKLDPSDPTVMPAFDVILLADTFWMRHQHDNLLKDLQSLLNPSGTIWAVAGLHSGRAVMEAFFSKADSEYGFRVERKLVVQVPIGSGSCDDLFWSHVPIDEIDLLPDSIDERKRYLFVYRMEWK